MNKIFEFFKFFEFVHFQTDIFAGTDLKECYNFEMGSIANATDFGKTNFKQTAARNINNLFALQISQFIMH